LKRKRQRECTLKPADNRYKTLMLYIAYLAVICVFSVVFFFSTILWVYRVLSQWNGNPKTSVFFILISVL